MGKGKLETSPVSAEHGQYAPLVGYFVTWDLGDPSDFGDNYAPVWGQIISSPEPEYYLVKLRNDEVDTYFKVLHVSDLADLRLFASGKDAKKWHRELMTAWDIEFQDMVKKNKKGKNK